MINAVNLALVKNFFDLLVQLFGGFKVVSEWLFDDHTPPRSVFFVGEIALSQLLNRGGKELRSNCEIKKVIPVGAVNFINFGELRTKSFVSFRISKLATH